MVLVWDLRIIVPALILIATGFVAFLPNLQMGHLPDLVGIALVPAVGGIVCSIGSFGLAPRFKPALAFRIVGTLVILLVPGLMPGAKILPFLPESMQELAILHMMLRLVLAGGLFLSLAESPLHFGFGVLLIVLVVNALVLGTYEGTTALLFLLNLMELAMLLALGHQTLRFPLWLSTHEEAQL